MKSIGALLFAVAATIGGAREAAAKCDDAAALAAARAAAAAECDCAGSRNHGQYVRCVNDVAADLVAAGALPRQCKGDVTRCAAQSTCGKQGFVTCCRTDSRGRT